MREVIQQVIAAEAQAAASLEEARAECARTLADAQRQAQELAEQSARAARVESSTLLAAAHEAADREKRARIARFAAELETQVGLDEAAAQRAVNAVVRCVCGQR